MTSHRDLAERQRKRLMNVFLLVVFLSQFSLLTYAAAKHSPTILEPGLVVAGISHWKLSRFDLFRVNPPFHRMVATIPAVFQEQKLDWTEYSGEPGARAEYKLGFEYFKLNGRSAHRSLFFARMASFPFSMAGAWICFLWSREAWRSNTAGCLALCLWVFDPNILAHGELITADCLAATSGLWASFLFWKWLKRPTWQNTVLAGCTLGLAQVSKFTWVILYVLWPIFFVISIRGCLAARRVNRKRIKLKLTALCLLSVIITNAAYGFDGSFTTVGKFRFISATLRGDDPNGENRFAGSILSNIPVPLPKQYILGIDQQKRDFEEFRQPSYINGTWADQGCWYYYLYGMLVKSPHGLQLAILIAVLRVMCEYRFSSLPRSIGRLLLMLIGPPAGVLAIVSSQTEFNQHIRYVLPVFPFCFVCCGAMARKRLSFKPLRTTVIPCSWHFLPPAVCLALVFLSTIRDFPNSLAYFNELSGGRLNGHAHLLGSNYDWGQDLYAFQDWLDQNPQCRPVSLAAYSYAGVQWLGSHVEQTPRMSVGTSGEYPTEPVKDRLKAGWHAVSGHMLYHYSGIYSYLQDRSPVAEVGATLKIFYLSDDDVRSLEATWMGRGNQ